MRLVLATPAFYGDPTLVANVEGLARAYRRGGHEVVVAGLRDPGAPVLGAGRRGVALLDGGPRGVLRGLRELLDGAEAAQLFVWGAWRPEKAAVWLACAQARVPRWVTFLDMVQTRGSGRAWSRFVEGAARVTALSRCLASELERALPSLAGRVEAIPAGFDPAELGAGRAGRARPRPYVLSLARLQPYKGTDVLLMAWSDVCRRIRGVDLVLCGPDHGRGRYQELARRLGVGSRAVFLGARDRPAVWSLLKDARAVVLASRREAFGVAVVEAMACGKAVLATRSGGPEEILEDGVSGLLVRPRDVEALRDGLLRLLGSAALRRRLGAKARTSAPRFAWDEVARRYLETVQPSLNSRPQSGLPVCTQFTQL